MIKQTYTVRFPARWIRATDVERELEIAGEPHGEVDCALFIVPTGCKIMIDAVTRLLSLVNQLAFRGKSVTLFFEQGIDGTMGYLDRVGFFDHLLPSVMVSPLRPVAVFKESYRGSNPGVVELRPISLLHYDRKVPMDLAHALENANSERPDHSRLCNAAFTVFAELIGNIVDHSETKVDGFAALQVYAKGGTAIITVSDSGRGIIDTLRPTLTDPILKELSDPELLIRMFNEGHSRYGVERGCGLKQCAEHALHYKANLFIRLPTSALRLVPAQQGGYEQRNIAYYQKDLPLLWGTHIVFEFRLN